jgi:hypothetical protein
MDARCNIESHNQSWQDYALGGQRLFVQCFPTLALSTPRVRTILGVDIYDDVDNIGLYGRYCGAGHPGEEFYHNFANSGNYQPKDPIDAVCLEHDAQDTNHELSTSDPVESLLATCIVRYGIEAETLYEDGVRVQPGSARWTAFWNAWPAMAESRQHWLNVTRLSCPDGDVTVGPVTIHGVYRTFLTQRGLSI